MNLPVEESEFIPCDILDAVRYLRQRNPAAAVRFVDSASTSCRWFVAQSCTLPYRRLAVGWASNWLRPPGLTDASQIANLRNGRVQLCATTATVTDNLWMHRFVEAFKSTVALLTRMPHLGRLRSDLGAPESRSWRVSGFRHYLVFYEVLPDRLRLLRVLHGYRDLQAELGK